MYRFIPSFGRSRTTLFKYYLYSCLGAGLLIVLLVLYMYVIVRLTMIFALDNDLSSTSKRRRFIFKTFLDVCKKYFIAVFLILKCFKSNFFFFFRFFFKITFLTKNIGSAGSAGSAV